MKIWTKSFTEVSKCKYFKKMRGLSALHIFPCFFNVFSDAHVFGDGNHGPFENRWSLLLEYILKLKITLKNHDFWSTLSFSAMLTSFAMVAFSFSLKLPALKAFCISKPKKMMQSMFSHGALNCARCVHTIHLCVWAPAELRPALAAVVVTAVTEVARRWALSTKHHVRLCSYLQSCQEILSEQGPQLS